MALKVECLDRISTVNKEEWDGVVREAKAPIFYQYDLLHAFEHAPLETFLQALYLIVRDEQSNNPLAVIPAYVQDALDLISLGVVSDNLSLFQGESRRGVFSHFWHCYDTCLPIALDSQEIVEVVCAALSEIASEWKASWYGFLNIDSSRDSVDLLSAAGLAPCAMAWNHFRLDLANVQTIDTYLEQLPSKVRAELRRQYKRLHESHAATEILSPPFDERDLEEVVRLCRSTAARFGTEFYYPAETFGDFIIRAGEKVKIVAVRLHDLLVGALVCFVDHRCFHVWAGGMRYDLTSFSPYYVGFQEAIYYAITSGMTLLEGGRGNPAVKEKLGLRAVPLHASLGKPERFSSN